MQSVLADTQVVSAELNSTSDSSHSFQQDCDSRRLVKEDLSASDSRPFSPRNSETNLPGSFQYTHLDSIRDTLARREMLEDSSKIIEASIRDSTKEVYDGKWRHFSTWCSRRDIDPFSPSESKLLRFFHISFEHRFGL